MPDPDGSDTTHDAARSEVIDAMVEAALKAVTAQWPYENNHYFSRDQNEAMADQQWQFRREFLRIAIPAAWQARAARAQP